MARFSQLLRSPSVRRAAESFLAGGAGRRSSPAPSSRRRPVRSTRGGVGGGFMRELTRQVRRRA